MKLPDFTVEHLKALPLRATVAFAARCARRVEPVALGPDRNSAREGDRGTIEAALLLADDFARGADAAPDSSVLAAIDSLANAPGSSLHTQRAAAAASCAAHAAATAWSALQAHREENYEPPLGVDVYPRKSIESIEHVTVDRAALDAFTAAADAYSAVGYENEDFVAAALKDYNRLLQLRLGRYAEPGEPIDPSPGGPLGRL